jgi:hypothetical protein
MTNVAGQKLMHEQREVYKYFFLGETECDLSVSKILNKNVYLVRVTHRFIYATYW